MRSLRLLGSLVALVLVAPALASAADAPARAETPVLRVVAAGDTDGDGLDDSLDGCPTVASGTPTGCPSASRRARLRWLEGKQRLAATITSTVTSCASRARIKLWRVDPQRDTRLLAVDASRGGRYRFRVPRGATYYVTVSPSYRPGEAECGQAVSRKVRVPRA
jgi:hypothetical protein